MKFSLALLFISFSCTTAIFGPIGDFFEDDIGGGLSDFGNWFSDTFDPVGGWFTGPAANFFSDVGNGIYFVLKETGNFFVSGYNAVRNFGVGLFVSVDIPTWQCYEKTESNGVTFRTNVPIKTVKTMFDQDGDPNTPDEEITDIACLLDSTTNDCDYGWCETPTNLADDAPSALCTEKPLWSEARDPCVVLYLGKANDPPTEPCALQAKHPVSGLMVNTFEGTPCFDGDYANGDDECFQGACVPSNQICRDDDDWSTAVGPFPVYCNGYPIDFCDQYPNAAGVTAATACPVTCNTCGAQGKPHIDNSLRSVEEPKHSSTNYKYLAAGGVVLGAALVFAVILKMKRRQRRAQFTGVRTVDSDGL